MKLPIPLAIAALTVTGLIVGPASPASAATNTTFSLTSGALSVTVGGTAALTNAPTSVAAQTISGNLGTVTVDDARGGTAGWTASAISSAFTGTGLSLSTAVNYTGGVVTKTGTSTVADGTQKALGPIIATAVVTATGVSGNNTATWNPLLAVTMPAGALAGNYFGTVTTSIA